MTNEERYQVDRKKDENVEFIKKLCTCICIYIGIYPLMYENAYMNTKIHIQFTNKNTYI